MPQSKLELVSVKVPKRLIELLEEKEYFGKTHDEWFSRCVRDGIDAELNELSDISEIRRLEKKYQLGVRSFLSCRSHGEEEETEKAEIAGRGQRENMREQNEKTAKLKRFCVPKTLYAELNSAAQSKGQTLEQYLDELVGALMCGEVAQ